MDGCLTCINAWISLWDHLEGSNRGDQNELSIALSFAAVGIVGIASRGNHLVAGGSTASLSA
jgi:hypothetical protein